MVTAIIQARTSSGRLPGKMLLGLGGKTVIENTIGRVRQARKVGKVFVATSAEPSDNALADLCEAKGVAVFRGALEDVLDRYCQAAKSAGAEHIVRITGDCPLIDPGVIDMVADEYVKRGCDYISTGRIASTYPDGMDTEIFSFAALERAWKEAKLPSEREHVTPYIWKHPGLFKIVELKNDRDLSHVRLTIDEPADYEVLKRIVAEVAPLSMENMVKYLEEHPEVAAVNGSIMRDEGYAKSLKADGI